MATFNRAVNLPFNLPFSGAVTQAINPWNAYFKVMGGQFGLVNINLGHSSNPQVEATVLEDVASYGKQLGRMGDALDVLIKHLEPQLKLNDDEQLAMDQLKVMLAEIRQVKRRVVNQQQHDRLLAN
ncbi:hypothetical protein [Silvimonas iriomotensis]|uniref:Uncharacterized protein n=1 Tax=Silvimonas iriomotensis TaxID=449662 RepID=A0ABQ2P5B6_9NEIS|nr:hypothetical protein [Silvimonas iriomotensis]GGP18202.1 hypothetical protein GCM10010970_03690 [Silvimonas iriomotensis]